MDESRVVIKVMADYESYPLWMESSSGVRNIAPEDLPLSDALVNDFRTWASKFDETLNRKDPLQSGFTSSIQSNDFALYGLKLSQRLAAELGEDYRVRYRDHRSGAISNVEKEEIT